MKQTIPMYELALHISRKLNELSPPFNRLDLEPADILRKEPSREELEFYYGRICKCR